MANCYGCPYRWHDEDCEYCSAKNDEIIDSKSYSKETCSIYRSYAESQGKSVSPSGSSSSSSYSSTTSGSGSSAGCGIGCAVILVIIVIIALLTTGTISFGGKKEAARQTAVVYNVDEAANMRDKPGGDNKLITSVPKGETVEIIKKDGKWWLVRYGEYEGYCNSKYLDIQD